MLKNRDYLAFEQGGVGGDYHVVGSYNLFMQCEAPDTCAYRDLPVGFSFRLCRRDELDAWMRVAVEEPYVGHVAEYYREVYERRADEFFRRCLFVCGAGDKPVATTFVWRSYGKINTIGWFRVLPEFEGRGLGRAILSEVLKNTDFPVYLHTQPTSARAIKLYSDIGFKLLTDPIVGHRKNDLAESLPFLEKVLPKGDYARLRFAEADKSLLEAASTSLVSEF
jgi:ribosomal protein S18 acetylase RimI-like enzyme